MIHPLDHAESVAVWEYAWCEERNSLEKRCFWGEWVERRGRAPDQAVHLGLTAL